ncbi:MAG TPA: response regulator [Flavobacterium sp.]|jgi:CheY-like chemotaxis protein
MLEKLLYVDDDADDLMIFNHAMNELGFPVSTFDSAAAILTALHNAPQEASIVFVDLNMAIKTGFDVIEEINQTEELRELHVVAFSTSNDPKTIKRCRDLGACLYLRKPNSMDKLRNMLKKVTSIDWTNFQATDDNFFIQA